MDSSNLSVVFAPNLLHSAEGTEKVNGSTERKLKLQAAVMQCFIENAQYFEHCHSIGRGVQPGGAARHGAPYLTQPLKQTIHEEKLHHQPLLLRSVQLLLHPAPRRRRCACSMSSNALHFHRPGLVSTETESIRGNLPLAPTAHPPPRDAAPHLPRLKSGPPLNK
ncbi:uncharacterized protein LOC114763591 isoform X1 [Denticeps clupeoides]|nr:uncharacterized protein LOC114763591 isoform X1 [Denticeps clupeoides]